MDLKWWMIFKITLWKQSNKNKRIVGAQWKKQINVAMAQTCQKNCWNTFPQMVQRCTHTSARFTWLQCGCFNSKNLWNMPFATTIFIAIDFCKSSFSDGKSVSAYSNLCHSFASLSLFSPFLSLSFSLPLHQTTLFHLTASSFYLCLPHSVVEHFF